MAPALTKRLGVAVSSLAKHEMCQSSGTGMGFCRIGMGPTSKAKFATSRTGVVRLELHRRPIGGHGALPKKWADRLIWRQIGGLRFGSRCS